MMLAVAASDPGERSTRWLLMCGVVGPLLFMGAALLEGVIEPGYDVWRDYVSDLSLGGDGWMQVTNFMVTGWLMMAFAVGLSHERSLPLSTDIGPVLFATLGVGLVGAGAFAIDPRRAVPSWHGTLHIVSSAVVLLSLVLACLLSSRRALPESTARWATYSRLTGIAVLVFALISALASADLPGLVQRAGFVLGALWIVAFAVVQASCSSARSRGKGGCLILVLQLVKSEVDPSARE